MLKYGIIGAGRLGNVHAGNIVAMENAKLAGVFDIDDAHAKAMAEKYGADVYASAEDLAKAVDAVVVASPSDCHRLGVEAAVNAGKPVFSEKPFCRDGADRDRLVKLLTGYGKPYGIGFVRRHMRKTQLLKSLLDDNAIGKLKFCNVDLPFGGFKRMYGDWFADYRRSGGVILDMLAHHIDLANFFFGRPVRVFAQGMMLDASQALPSDYVSSTVTYANGVIVNFMCTWQRFGRSGEMMEIYGDKGCLTMCGDEFLTHSELGKDTVKINANEADAIGVSNMKTGSGFANEIAAFTEAVEKGGAYTPSLAEGIASFAVADGMMKSAETNKVIELA